MKDIVNILLAIVVLFVSSWLWGDDFAISGIALFVIAGVVLAVVEALVSIFVFYMFNPMLLEGKLIAFDAILVLVMVMVSFFTLMLLDAFFPGIVFLGMYTKMFTAFMLTIVRIPDINVSY